MRDESTTASSGPSAGEPERAAEPITVLVVDDEPANRLILKKMLRGIGYAAIDAADGQAALDAIQRQRFDLVLLDISMPVMDGFEALRRMRLRHSPTDLPVIMVTASNESEQIVTAFKLGANDYVTKPIDHAVTLARIQMHIRFAQAQVALKKSEERYALVARGTNDGLWDWDLTTNEVYYSPRWHSMVGVEECDSSPNAWLERIHSEDRPRVESELRKHIAGQSEHLEAELRIRHADGSYRWMLCRGQAVWNEKNVATRIAGSLTDITGGKVADALTGLPNRVLFRERLDRCAAKKQRRSENDFALMYLDLDNFKHINDSMGHDAGDRLLVAIARRLESSLRDADSFVSRLGGDEFAIILEGINKVEDAEQVAKRIVSSVNSPISLGSGREIFASVSVGISTSIDGIDDAAGLLQAADAAMYHAKQQGKSCYRVYDPEMRKSENQRIDIATELEIAVENESFYVHYQPIVDLQSMQMTGVEALVRWTHPRFGNIEPATFVPIAEENGAIVEIGRQVLRIACRQMVQWHKTNQAHEHLRLNVNLSSRQLCDPDLFDDISGVLKETGMAADLLRLEVTEKSIMRNSDKCATVLARLRRNGVRIAIDDFGTGFSSLAYLHDLSPDLVKIDRSFVDQLTTSLDKQTIVGAIIALATGLNLNVIAEGVETEEQRKLLTEMGCTRAQGFLFSRPMCADDADDFSMGIAPRFTVDTPIAPAPSVL